MQPCICTGDRFYDSSSSTGDEQDPTEDFTAVDNHTHMTEVDTEFLMANPPSDSRHIGKSIYALPPASLTFKDLSFSLMKKDGISKKVLEPCSGHFEPGELSALMGPSGSGKTTLLDMLAMKKTVRYEGDVRVNGRQRHVRLFRRIAAYVGQEDMMPAHWKVREAVKFNAVLKKNPARAHRSTDDWIDVLLETFGLSVVEDSLIGGIDVRGISGGQRRRVSLARGVAAHASLLFCDEPTSGLSATDAELCIKALRTIAKRINVTVLVVIHQPRAEVAELFDKFILLTSNPGRMAYFGAMSTAQAYWNDHGFRVPDNVNPTDYFMDTVTPGTRTDASDFLVDAFHHDQKPFVDVCVKEGLENEGLTVKQMLIRTARLADTADGSVRIRLGRHAVPFWGQVSVLLNRKLRLTLRNPVAVGLPIAVPVIQGLVVGYMFVGTGTKPLLRQVMFAFCMLTMLCLAGTMGLVVLISDRNLMKHEASEALYSEDAWALATQCVDVPLALTGAVLNIFIMVGFAQLDMEIFNTVLFWSLLLFFVYDSLFACIAAIAVDVRQAQVLASPCVSIFMLFNGFIVTEKDAPIPLRWIFSISPNAYAMEAIVVRMAQGAGIEGQMLLEQFGYQESKSVRGIWVMAALILCLRVTQMLALKLLNHIKR